jgi:hypothetical protein
MDLVRFGKINGLKKPGYSSAGRYANERKTEPQKADATEQEYVTQ